MIEKIIKVLKSDYSIVPNILLNNYKNLHINDSELILIIYLMNNDKTFNAKKISNDLKFDLPTIMQMIDNLMKNDLLSIDVVKNNGISEDVLNIDNIYKKLAYLLVDDKVETKENNLFELFEQKFGRTLSSLEYGLINAWIDSGYSEEIITLALEEAIYNGASSLKYIDRILYMWNKKNLKTKEDIIKEQTNFRSTKDRKELFDYDWLSDPDVRNN